MQDELISGQYVHADETTIQVLDEPEKKSTSKSYMWVYASINESEKPIRIFEYKPTRAGYNPKEFLNGFKGAVITDAYAGYNHLKNTQSISICAQS